MVTDVWDWVELTVEGSTRVGALKTEALARALGRVVPADEYEVKFHGAAVSDGATLASLGAGSGAPFIILTRRRQPVR